MAGTAPDYGFQKVLQSAGLSIGDVRTVNASYVNMGQMLVSGGVDAMVGIEPYLSLTQQKLGGEASLLVRMGKYVQGGGLFLISDAWAAAHPRLVDEAVLALWEAEQFVRQHPADAAAIEAEFIKAPLPSVELAFKRLEFDPRIDAFTLDSVKQMSGFLAASGKIPRALDAQTVLGPALAVQSRLEKAHPELLR